MKLYAKKFDEKLTHKFRTFAKCNYLKAKILIEYDKIELAKESLNNA